MKQKFTRFLLMMLLVLGVTTAWAQKSVLDESFASGSLPSNWTAGSFWKFQDGNAKFEALIQDGKDTLFSPLLDLSDLTNKPSVAITYSNIANGDKVNELKVLYRASLTDEWSVLQTFSNAAVQSSWKGELPTLPSAWENVQIALAGAYLGGAETRVYRLAVENKTEAADAPTGLKTEELTTNSVTLWWDVCESTMFQQYNVKVSTSPMSDMSADGDVINYVNVAYTDEWLELSELTPNTEYWLYVQYDCGDGDLSPWAELSFRTPCEAITGTFAENFEGAISTCYTIIKGGAAAEVSGEYAYNSQKAFKSNSVKGKYNYLILPEFTGDVKNFQVSFMAAAADAGNTYARTVTVGVCTDATAESFTEVKTLDLPKGRTWEQIVVTLKGYQGAGKYIAFRFGNEDKENRIVVDDIKIEVADACPKPMFVEVYEINPSSAKLKWVETGDATEWNLVLSTKYLVDPEDIEPDAAKGEFAGSISANPYTATNLQPNTTYYAYVQAGCGSSEWTNAVEFKTSRAVTYPYSEHFDRMEPDAYTNTTAAIPNGWVFDDRGNNNQSGNSYYDKQYTSDSYRPYVTTAQNNETTAYVSASLYLRGTSISSSTSTGYTSIAMMPAMPKPVNTMMVTFWAKATGGNQTLKVGVANTQTNDLVQGKQLGENITEVGEATIIKDEWKQYKVLLTGYTGEGRYITFYMKPGTSTPYIYIDDIVVDDAPDCNAVSTLNATATGIDKATAEWTDASSSTSWIIKVSSTEIDPSSADGDIVASKTVNAKSYDITGMSMGQTYYIYVSPTCGDAWMSTNVTTLVGLQVPYYNDFTNETTGTNANRGPKNWKLGYTYTDSPSASSSYWPYINTTAWTNPPAGVEKNSLYLYNGTSASYQYPYAIMPELLNADVKDLKLSFYLYTTLTANLGTAADPYYDELKIGVVNSPSDINKTDKFTKVTNVATVRAKASKVAQMEVLDLAAYTGTGKYIVFYQAMESPNNNKANHSYIDNLSITLASAPQPVSNVVASDITQTGAKLTWTENGQATKWEVCVFDAPQDDPVEGNPVFAELVETTAEATINTLNPSTKYYAYVRSVQGQEVGAWGSTSFRTECGVSAVPFTEDWEGYAASAGSLAETCYEQTNGAQVAGSGSPNATVKTGQVIKFNATSTNKEPMVVFPALDKPIKTLQLTMNASPYTSSYVGDASYTEIGVLEGDLDGEHTFVKIAEYRFTLSDVKAWDECFVNFGTYEGEGGRIAIRSSYTAVNKATHICFDNVLIEQIPQCGRITTIEVTEIDSVSAKVAWEKGKTENAWNLKISSTELEDPATGNADAFSGKVTEQSKVIDGLEGNTTYYVYVQSVDEALECEGQWSNAKTFKTTCKKQTFPYEEDFESYETGSGKDLGCNTICGPDANHSYISTKNSSKALYLRQATKGNHNYFVFPALSVDSVKRLQLSMQVYSGGTTATTKYAFEVGVMTDPNDPSTFVATHKDTVMGSSTAYDRSYTFENYAGDESGENFGTFIALKAMEYTSANGSTYAGYVYVDNVYIDFIETCPAATDLKTDSVGTYGAKFSWLTSDKTVPHRIRIYDDATAKPSSEDFVAEVVVSDTTSVIIEGLQSLTKYYAFVRKECGANDLSKWSSAWAFKTECPETRAIPYEEGFDGDTDPLADYCWSSFMIQGPSGCTTDYNSKSSTSAKKDGTRGLYLQYTTVPDQAGGSCVGTHRSAAITPALDVENLKELLLYFDVKSSSSTAKAGVKIEAVSDQTKDADAIYITTINDIEYGSWQKAYVRIADYYTSVQPYKYLRFTTTTAASAYIDNVVLTKDLNVVLPVEDMKVQMLTENSVKFSFVEFTPAVNEWQIAYVAAGGDIADATLKTINETEYTIEGLTTNTSYDIYVRGNVEGSDWTGPLTATTIQAPAPLPLITGFEDAEDNAMWNLYNLYGDGIHTYPNFWIVGKADSCAGTGYNALFITNDSSSYKAFDKNDGHNMDPIKYAYQGSNIVATSYVWATRNIKIDGAGTYKFSFKFKVPKCYSSDGLYAQLIPAGATYKAGTATLVSGATRSGSATTATDAGGCYLVMGKQNNVEDWTWYNTSLDVEEPGIYTLALYWYNPSAGEPYATPAAIDSVIVEEYLCTTPKDVEFVNRGANEVSLKWFGGKCKNFEYVLSRYAKLGNPALIDAEDKVAYGTLTEGPQVTISNLMPQTNYSFYVRTICEDGMTDWVEYDFVTPCGLYELPYTEGFFETPECWILSGATMGTTQVGTGSSDYEKWYRMSLAKNGYAILPELAVDLKNVEVEIGLFNTTTYYGAVSLGVMDNTWDLDSYQEVAFFQTEFKNSNAGSTYSLATLEVFHKMLNLYKGTGKVLAIKNATDNAIGVKYVKLTELPDCVRPQQVELTFVTENSVTVNWLAGVEEAWEIKINDSIIDNVTTNPYKITGLEQGTVYEVSVRALCDAEHASEWSIPVTFQTDCGVNALPLFEDFSGLKAENKRATMTCWSNMATDYPIEQVFNGTISPYEPDGGTYYTYMWITNYLNQLGDEHQLLFFGSTLLNSGPKYRWMITPQYAIEGKASLSFDVKHVDNKNMAAYPDGRFMVAISTDNGATWKSADATVIDGIDSVFTTKSVSLDKYAGQNIRVAFYMENLGGTTTTKGSGLFTLLDNVRMNCTDEYQISDNACQGYDYEGNGFSIKAEELPVAGESKEFTRFAANTEAGCDSTVILTLTTHTAKMDTVYATICQGEAYVFGPYNLTEPNPAGIPYKITGSTVFGCDSTIYLYLTVLDADTTSVEDAVKVNIKDIQLPYHVDDYYTVPADAPMGEFEAFVKTEACHYNRYIVTVSACVAKEKTIEASICEGEYYEFNGEKLTEPNPEGQPYAYYGTAVDGCDSIVYLNLTVQANDTTDIPVTKLNTELPYDVDQFYTIPATAEVGSFEVVLPNGNKCSYNRYIVTIEQCTQQENESDNTCEGKDYQGYGFVIPVAEQPAVDMSKEYKREEMIEGCKVITTLTLTVVKNDTTVIPVDIKIDQLPYIVDAIYTVPAEAQIGSFDETLPNGEDCGYNRYEVKISDTGTGLINVTDDVDRIEIYDVLGRKVATFRQGDDAYQLPTGVYMIHTVMKSGNVENRKVTLK